MLYELFDLGNELQVSWIDGILSSQEKLSEARSLWLEFVGI